MSSVRGEEHARVISFLAALISDLANCGQLRIETEVRACLQLSAAQWNEKFRSAKKPGREDLIVFLSTRGKRAQRVAAAAADLGYNG